MSEEYLDIVDQEDSVIGKKLRTLLSKQDIYRVSSLWVFDKNKKLLISKRPLWKKHDPGQWTESAVGTVSSGETYDSNLVRESKEELGLDLNNSDLIFVSKQFHESRNGRMFGAMYAVILNEVEPKVETDKNEVPETEWIEHDKIVEEFRKKDNRFVTGLKKFYREVWNKVSKV